MTEGSGSWQAPNERPTSFRNPLRWTWDVALGTIRLQRQHRGAERPVHLVVLIPDGPDRLTSAAPYFCAADQYRAELSITGSSFELQWTVTGPTKRYSLATTYSPAP